MHLCRFMWAALAAALSSAGLAALGATNAPLASVPAPVIRTWSTAAGLPQNTISSLAQSRDGYLWIGTSDGLVRFDGVRFTVYGLDQGLDSVEVRVVHQDRQGTLWVITEDGHLSHAQQDRFERLPGGDADSGADVATCLAEDAEGRLWVGTRAGVRVLQGGRPVKVPGLAQFDRTNIRALLYDGHDTLWIATQNEGLFSYRGGRASACAGPPGDETIVAPCLLADRQGRLWVSVGNGKVLCREQDQWRVYHEQDGLPFPYITCLAEGADGSIWAGSLDAGLYRFDGERFHALRQADGLAADDIRSLLADREGNVWVGTRTGGLNCLSPPRLRFVGPELGLTNNYTRGIAQTPDGTLWVAATGGGLYQGGLAGFHAFARTNPVVGFYPHAECVLAASDGSLWWGGGGALLRWQDGQLANAFTNEPWVRGLAVTALLEDRTGGLWIGNSAGQLQCYRAGHFTMTQRHVGSGAITALAAQSDGALWVGSVAGGVQRIREGSDEVLALTNGLTSRCIRTLYCDADGTLWIGTSGGGLACWRDGRTLSFTPAQGFTPRTVSQIVEDDFHGLWLGCNRGVFEVRKQDLLECAAGRRPSFRLRSFGVDDGMLTDECSGGFSPAGLKTRSGLICISTLKGLAVFDPAEKPVPVKPPTALIEEVLVNRRPQPLTPNAVAPTDTAPSFRLTLRPGERDLEIHYTAIQFFAPEKIGFRYRLTGLEDEWTDAGWRRTAYYSRLDPGDYTFRVQACNVDGVWHEQASLLTFTVPPFFWETATFRALAVLALAGSGSGALGWVLRRRYRRRLDRLQLVNAVERERLRISKDMHDQVGGMLTQVSQLSDMALGEFEQQDQVKGRLERIGRRSRAAVQALDEIVWATNPKNDNLASFAEYVSRFGDEFFEASPVRCWQEVPTDLPALPLRADIRHNVFLAVREACNNTLKHAKATEVWLRLAFVDHRVRIEIEDNGRGFNPEQVPPGGNGLENLRARMAEENGTASITSSPDKGTVVRLDFPLGGSVEG
jgi:ligand-binding sensor domain-containing protein/signal transduction histidine kinase